MPAWPGTIGGGGGGRHPARTLGVEGKFGASVSVGFRGFLEERYENKFLGEGWMGRGGWLVDKAGLD